MKILFLKINKEVKTQIRNWKNNWNRRLTLLFPSVTDVFLMVKVKYTHCRILGGNEKIEKNIKSLHPQSKILNSKEYHN